MADQTVTGKVRFCHAVSGTGMVLDPDGNYIFFHTRQLTVDGKLFQAIVPGKKISFVPVRSQGGRGGWQMKEGTLELLEGTGIAHDPEAPELWLEEQSGFVKLRIDALGRMVATDARGRVATDRKPIKPSEYADGYVRAYFGGYCKKDAIKGFNLTLPEPSAELVVILADGQKNPRRFQQEEYERISLGSYICVANSDGRVRIFVIGIRQQPIKGHHAVSRDGKEMTYRWVVIHNRFEQKFDPALVSTESEVAAQIPSSGMRRDNDGFAKMIAAAFERMCEAKAAN